MIFGSTYFYGFRNIVPMRMSWPPGFCLITGPNGAGKTNFLEGLSIVSGWGPFDRSARLGALINWASAGPASAASLWARASGEGAADLYVKVASRRQITIDGRPARSSAARAVVPVMPFMTDNIDIVLGSASDRRALLDRVGALVSAGYAEALSRFRRALKQKSSALRRGIAPDAADRVFAPLAASLWREREAAASMIAAELPGFAGLLPCEIGVAYARGGGGRSPDASEDIALSLAACRERERASGTALAGPQRDELEITARGRAARMSLSRGESRRAASALVLAAARAVERRVRRRPVLLFDEYAAELDCGGAEIMTEAVMSTGAQVFAATAASGAADAFRASGASVFRIERGRFI